MSKVVLRRPRRIFGANGGSGAQPTGRPKSWGEFHQNFRSVSESVTGTSGELTINEEDNVVNAENKKRANSSSLLLDAPTFRSVAAPRRSTSMEPNIKINNSHSAYPNDDTVFESRNISTETVDHAKDKAILTEPEATQDILNPIQFQFEAPSKKVIEDGSSADESCDSAIAISMTSTSQQQDTISNLSSNWSTDYERNLRTSYDLESISNTSNCDVTEAEKPNQPNQDYFVHKMSHMSSEGSSSDIENYYADRSTEESVRQVPKSLRARKQQSKKTTQLRQTLSDEDVAPKNVAYSTGSWPRRKKDGMDKSPDELMRQFRELAADHVSKMKTIYSESRRKIDDILLSLKLTMTKNGYNKSQKQIS